MKKIILAFVAILCFALLVAGCGQSTSETTEQTVEDALAVEEQTAQTAPASEATTEPAAAMETTSSTTESSSMSSATPSDSVTSQESSPLMTEEVAGCTDSDGGKNYELKGSLVDAHDVTDVDRCSTNENYPGRLYESYCKEDGNRGRETYDCPSGSCMNGACVAVDNSMS